MWTALTDSLCDLGESPFWHPQERSLYWLDIAGCQVLRTRGPIGAGVQVERWPLPLAPGCMAPARRGGLVIALRDGIYRAHAWGGPLARMAAAAHDGATMRFNDGKCDPLGRFWAGSINEAKTGRNAALYCLDPRAAGAVLEPKAGDAMTANGLAFGAGTLYWTDTPSHTIRAYPWEPEANRLGPPRAWRRFDAKQEGAPYGGRPDGATLDAQGRYWVAMYEGAQVLCLDGAGGGTLAALSVPVQCPTMPCFGGDDLRTLFVTSACKGRPADELARQPDAGRVLMQRVEAAGRPVDFFDD